MAKKPTIWKIPPAKFDKVREIIGNDSIDGLTHAVSALPKQRLGTAPRDREYFSKWITVKKDSGGYLSGGESNKFENFFLNFEKLFSIKNLSAPKDLLKITNVTGWFRRELSKFEISVWLSCWRTQEPRLVSEESRAFDYYVQNHKKWGAPETDRTRFAAAIEMLDRNECLLIDAGNIHLIETLVIAKE